MAIREIVIEGDPVLNKRCHPVTKFDEKLGALRSYADAVIAKFR